MPHKSKPLTKPSRSDTLRLSQELNEKYFNEIQKNIEISDFSVIKDDVSNYRPLTKIQLSQLETLTEKEKIELIKTYNTIVETLNQFVS
jgi:hypothetical protein